jgi:hypothetical protein
MKFSALILETIQSISIQELAAEFQVADSTILRWANGTAKPHPKLQKLIMAKIKDISKTIPKIVDSKPIPLIDHQTVASALGAKIISPIRNTNVKVNQQIPKGTKVRMSQQLKNNLLNNGSQEHLKEFGDCIGVVVGLVFPNGEGPELDVRWQPSNLRYGYSPELLEIVD